VGDNAVVFRIFFIRFPEFNIPAFNRPFAASTVHPMSFFGSLLCIVPLLLALLLGYDGDFNRELLLALPVVVVLGVVIRRGARSSRSFRSGGIGILFELAYLYLIGLIWVAVAFGAGMGLAELLKHRPDL